MASRKDQKMFYYSTDETKQFIEGRLEDMANRTHCSISGIIEDLLLKAMLPMNDQIGDTVLNHLYADEEGVKTTLVNIFEKNAAGTDWNSVHSNLKPLVDFCIESSDSSVRYANTDGRIHYLIRHLQDITERIENCTDFTIDVRQREANSACLKTAKILLEISEKNPTDIVFKDYFRIISDCYDMLDDWSITYRYLSCLVSMSMFVETSSSRNKLFDIISAISEEW